VSVYTILIGRKFIDAFLQIYIAASHAANLKAFYVGKRNCEKNSRNCNARAVGCTVSCAIIARPSRIFRITSKSNDYIFSEALICNVNAFRLVSPFTPCHYVEMVLYVDGRGARHYAL